VPGTSPGSAIPTSPTRSASSTAPPAVNRLRLFSIQTRRFSSHNRPNWGMRFSHHWHQLTGAFLPPANTPRGGLGASLRCCVPAR
jgi:hypothetical protein